VFSLLPVLLHVALAQTIVFQDTIQGGISVDASGVAAPSDSTSWYGGDPLVVQIPSGATIQHAYAIVHAEAPGFGGDPTAKIAINGVSLSSATLVSAQTVVRA